MKRLPPICLSSLLAGLAISAAHGAWLTVSDNNLEARFDDQTAELVVRQKASGREWRQAAAPGFTVEQARSTGGAIEVRLQGPPALHVVWRIAANSDLAADIESDPAAPAPAFAFPGPFETPGDDWQLVFPLSEGVLLPMREVATALRLGWPFPLYNMSGLIMPWAGVSDPALRAGYMMIVDTPFDAAIRLADRAAVPAPEAVWEPETGRFGYPRKLRYHFFEQGGYVAQAKHYRDQVRRTREFSTLRERARQRPAIDQLIGAVHIYAWDDGRSLALARELKQAGIDRAWFGWDPSHPPYPAQGYDEGLKELGYLAGVYNLYRDCYDDAEWGKKAATNQVLRGMWLHRYSYPGHFQQIVARTAGNKPMQIRVSGDVGLMRYWTCTKAQLPYVHERITRELAVYPHNSVFIDVTLAAGPFECRSPEHPMTRREDAAARVALHKIMADELHLVVGSEWGADYGVAHTEFMHGLMTLSSFWGEGTRDAASPYYHGDFKNTIRPTMMFGEAQPTAAYWKYGLGPEYRIPLYELVYHDCTVSSWRWDDNSHKMPAAWARKDLFTTLYASAPLWNLDQATWRKYRERFVAGFKAVSPVLRAVGYDEMTNHRFLSPDRTLQETSFSSGRRVIVNFGDAARQLGDTTVAAGGFVMLEK